jgi:hypothetical protein
MSQTRRRVDPKQQAVYALPGIRGSWDSVVGKVCIDDARPILCAERIVDDSRREFGRDGVCVVLCQDLAPYAVSLLRVAAAAMMSRTASAAARARSTGTALPACR